MYNLLMNQEYLLKKYNQKRRNIKAKIKKDPSYKEVIWSA
jgi:hypothetical protein